MDRQELIKNILIFVVCAAIPVLSFFDSSGIAHSAGVGCGVGGKSKGKAKGVPCSTPPPPTALDDPSTGPNAEKTDSPMCDANFMNQIYAKAFLEAEREVVVANSIILKPDSVLEYACPDQNMARIAEDAGPIFSESDRWSTDNIDVVGDSVTIDVFMGDTRLDSHIENMTLSTMVTYANSEFPHDFLANAASGDDHNLSGTVSGVAGVCDHMYNINHIAKCEDFGLNPPFIEFEAFYSTPALESTDPRLLPVTCPAGHQVTTAAIEVAKNEDWTYAANDPIVTNFEITRDSNYSAGGGNCENSDPIPTGVIVYFKQYDQDPAGNPILVDEYEYEDKFCSNPACYFENNSNAGGGDDTCEPQP